MANYLKRSGIYHLMGMQPNTRIAKTSSTCVIIFLTLEFTQCGIFLQHRTGSQQVMVLGGTTRSAATKACFQHPYDNHILTSLQLYEFAVGHIQGMHFGFATVQEHDEEAKMLEERHKMSRTVPGTQSLHSFIPLSACMAEVRLFSKSTICRAERVVHRVSIHCAPHTAIGIGGYVTVVYNEACWLGCMLSVMESECVDTVKFQHPHLPSISFVFPDQEDVMDIDSSDILTDVNPITATGRTYTLSKTDTRSQLCSSC